MEDVIDLIATNSSPAEISDKIKSVLFAKSAERIENSRPYIASMMFGDDEQVENTEEN